MGYVIVNARISNLNGTKSKQIELIADTGAIYTAIPENILEELGVERKDRRKFKMANGELRELPVGEASLEIQGRSAISLVVFLPRDAKPILGITTLELLGLQVDPITGQLKPMELLLLGCGGRDLGSKIFRSNDLHN